MEISQVESNCFLFIFEDEGDRRWVVANEPWHFDKALLVLKEMDFLHPFLGLDSPSPPVCNDQINWYFHRGQVGQVIEVESDGNGNCFGQYLCVRVLLNIRKPIRRGSKVRLGLCGKVCWVDFKYEKLPEFCYVCGIIGHITRDCVADGAQAMRERNELPYGVFMTGSSMFKPFGQTSSKSKGIVGKSRGGKGPNSPAYMSTGPEFSVPPYRVFRGVEEAMISEAIQGVGGSRDRLGFFPIVTTKR